MFRRGAARELPPPTPKVGPLESQSEEMIPLECEVRGEVIRRFDLSGPLARVVRYRAGCRMPRHAHEWSSLTLVLAGSFVDCVEGGTFETGPLTLLTKPAGARHETRVGPDGALTLNFRMPENQPEGAAFGRGAAEHCTFCAAGHATARLLGLPLGLAGGQPGSALIAGTSRVFEDGVKLPLAARDEHPTGGGGWASTRTAASAARIHPVAFARRFRRQTGWSPCQWRIFGRVAQAAAALADSGASIAAIAADLGFADQAHLGRQFKRETGLTPREFRERVKALGRA